MSGMHVHCLWRGLGRSMIMVTPENGADILSATNRIVLARRPLGPVRKENWMQSIPRPLGSYGYFPVGAGPSCSTLSDRVGESR